MQILISTKNKITLARWLYLIVASGRTLKGGGPVGIFKRQGLLWELDLREGIDFVIYISGQFERTLGRFFRENVKQGDVVYDIGANIGAHAIPLSRQVGRTGKVEAFEPTDFAYRKLVRNLSLNPEISISLRAQQLFLADDLGAELTKEIPSAWPMRRDASRDYNETHWGRHESTEGASVTTLSDYFYKNSERIDWIKLDVDGNELKVLKGGYDVIAVQRPKMVLELAPGDYSDDGFLALVELLNSLDYNFYSISSGRLLNSDGKALLKNIPRGSSVNVYLQPK